MSLLQETLERAVCPCCFHMANSYSLEINGIFSLMVWGATKVVHTGNRDLKSFCPEVAQNFILGIF